MYAVINNVEPPPKITNMIVTKIEKRFMYKILRMFFEEY